MIHKFFADMAHSIAHYIFKSPQKRCLGRGITDLKHWCISKFVRHWYKISPLCFCMPCPNSRIAVSKGQKTPPSRQHPWKACAKMNALQIVDFRGRTMHIPWIHAHCCQKSKKNTILFGGSSSAKKVVLPISTSWCRVFWLDLGFLF